MSTGDTDKSVLNRQIAELMGWTRCEFWQIHSKWAGVDPDTQTMCVMPDYCGDHGESMRLLEHILTLDYDVRSLCQLDTKQYAIRLRRTYGHHRRPNIDAEYDILPLAIATACLAALVVLKGEETP